MGASKAEEEEEEEEKICVCVCVRLFDIGAVETSVSVEEILLERKSRRKIDRKLQGIMRYRYQKK